MSRGGGFVQVANVGHSTYHSFQADVKGRMSSRALWNLAYTFSKSIDNISSDQVKGVKTPYPRVRRATFSALSVDIDDEDRER